MISRILPLIFLFFASPATSAGFSTGNMLYDHCFNGGEPGNIYCIAFVTAIADVLERGSSVNGNRSCMPRTVKVGQLVDITKKFLRDYPEARHYGASDIVSFSLQQAYPCK